MIFEGHICRNNNLGNIYCKLQNIINMKNTGCPQEMTETTRGRPGLGFLLTLLSSIVIAAFIAAILLPH